MGVKDSARGRGPGAVIAVLLAGLAATAPDRASAHPEFSSMGTNRYVTAAVFDGHVDVTDAWLHGALSAAETRRALDANRDGQIDAGELKSAEEQLRAEGPHVTVELDGRPATAPLSVSIDLGGDPRVGPSPVVVERRVRLARDPAAHETQLRLSITREPPRLLETELSIVLGPTLHLTGPDRLHFDGPRRSSLETRAATFTIVAAPTPRRPWLAIAAAVLLTAGLALGLWIRTRKTP